VAEIQDLKNNAGRSLMFWNKEHEQLNTVSMNDWLPLVVTLRNSALDQLPIAQEMWQTKSPQEIVSLESQMSADLDASIRVFARTHQWPEISAIESFYLHVRIQFGLVVAEALATPDTSKPKPQGSVFPSPPQIFSLEDQLEWLLICAWNNIGRKSWTVSTIPVSRL